MRSGKSIAALALLALAAGCGRKQIANAPPPTAQAPAQPPSTMADASSSMPPTIPVPDNRSIKLDTNVPTETSSKATVAPTPKRPVKHHPKPAPQEAAQPETPRSTVQPVAQTPPPSNEPPLNEPQTNAAPNPQVASGQPSEMSPIGQLSTTSDNANTADRHLISDQIDSTENGLNGIKRALSSEEQKTAAQIRTFITRARDALKADDLDGARTLSTKAKLLLEELIKQ